MQLSQLDEILNDFVIGNSVNANVSESENLEQETNGQPNDLERVSDIARQNQVIEKKLTTKVQKRLSVLL